MKHATFYVLPQLMISHGLTASEQLACDLATDKWREGKRILIACENNCQAVKLDNALWTRNSNAFVPHNLIGKDPYNNGAPVEISWTKYHIKKSQDLLISLLPVVFTDFVFIFHEVIDFVPNEKSLKQLARNRYKAYRNIGFRLTTTIPLTQ